MKLWKGKLTYFYCPECGNITKSKQEYREGLCAGVYYALIICESCKMMFAVNK